MSDHNEEMLISIHTLLVSLTSEVAVLKNIVEGVNSKHAELKEEFRDYREKTDSKIVEQGKEISRIKTARDVDAASWKGPKTVITVISAIVALAASSAVIYDKIT